MLRGHELSCTYMSLVRARFANITFITNNTVAARNRSDSTGKSVRKRTIRIERKVARSRTLHIDLISSNKSIFALFNVRSPASYAHTYTHIYVCVCMYTHTPVINPIHRSQRSTNFSFGSLFVRLELSGWADCRQRLSPGHVRITTSSRIRVSELLAEVTAIGRRNLLQFFVRRCVRCVSSQARSRHLQILSRNKIDSQFCWVYW